MPLQFDIRAILKRKAPNARVPEFLIRYLERITHIEQMNAFLRVHTTEKDYDFIKLVLDEENRFVVCRDIFRTADRSCAT